MTEKCDEHTGCVTQIKTNKENIDKIFEMLEKIRNRPPIYVSFLFAVLTGIIGWLLKTGGKL